MHLQAKGNVKGKLFLIPETEQKTSLCDFGSSRSSLNKSAPLFWRPATLSQHQADAYDPADPGLHGVVLVLCPAAAAHQSECFLCHLDGGGDGQCGADRLGCLWAAYFAPGLAGYFHYVRGYFYFEFVWHAQGRPGQRLRGSRAEKRPPGGKR